MNKRTEFVTLAVSKKDAEIIAELVIREIGEIHKLKNGLEERGISLLPGINCHLIDLKYILQKFSEAAETKDGE